MYSLYSFKGYRFRMWAEGPKLCWTPLESMPDEVLLELKRWLRDLAAHVRLNLERAQSPEKFWVAEFDKRIADGWIKSR